MFSEKRKLNHLICVLTRGIKNLDAVLFVTFAGCLVSSHFSSLNFFLGEDQ